MKVKILGLRKVQLSHVGQILITLRTGQILPTVQDFALEEGLKNYQQTIKIHQKALLTKRKRISCYVIKLFYCPK